MALVANLSDQESVRIIMDAVTNELQGLAALFCNEWVEAIQDLVSSAASTVTTGDVTDQVSVLKNVLCGYTAKESAIAEIIKSAGKKTAVDLNKDPSIICKCNCCNTCNE